MSANVSKPSRRRAVVTSPYTWAVLAGLIAIPAMRPLLRFEPAPPPRFGALPAFSLRDPSGHAFGSAQLNDRVYVAGFFAVRCADHCPQMLRTLAALAERYRRAAIDDVWVVGISVDEEPDPGPELRAAAAGLRAAGPRFVLLGGDAGTVAALLERARATPAAPRFPLEGPPGAASAAPPPARGRRAAHRRFAPEEPPLAGRLLLVDRHGGLRGAYASDELGLDEVFHRAQHVAREPRGATR